jgi:transcriptional regulator with XRE-family HTH domain
VTALERWRQAKKLSYEQMAAKLQESRTSVFMWCNAKARPRESKWANIRRATGLTDAQIMGLAK